MRMTDVYDRVHNGEEATVEFPLCPIMLYFTYIVQSFKKYDNYFFDLIKWKKYKVKIKYNNLKINLYMKQ